MEGGRVWLLVDPHPPHTLPHPQTCEHPHANVLRLTFGLVAVKPRLPLQPPTPTPHTHIHPHPPTCQPASAPSHRLSAATQPLKWRPGSPSARPHNVMGPLSCAGPPPVTCLQGGGRGGDREGGRGRGSGGRAEMGGAVAAGCGVLGKQEGGAGAWAWLEVTWRGQRLVVVCREIEWGGACPLLRLCVYMCARKSGTKCRGGLQGGRGQRLCPACRESGWVGACPLLRLCVCVCVCARARPHTRQAHCSRPRSCHPGWWCRAEQ